MKRFFVTIAVLLSIAAPLRAFYCSQIPADCGCPAIAFGHFLSCGPRDSMLSCYGPGYLIVLGKLLAHPEDTGRLVYNENGGIGKFVIEDVIAPNPGNTTLSPGDTLEAASGGSCYRWYRPDSVTRVVALYQQVDGRDTKITCYYIPGCMNSILSFADDKVIGVIDYPSIDTMPYADFKQLIAAKTGTASPGKRVGAPMHNREISAHRADNRLILNYELTSLPGNELIVSDLKGRLLMRQMIRSTQGTCSVGAAGSVFVVKCGGAARLVVVK